MAEHIFITLIYSNEIDFHIVQPIQYVSVIFFHAYSNYHLEIEPIYFLPFVAPLTQFMLLPLMGFLLN